MTDQPTRQDPDVPIRIEIGGIAIDLIQGTGSVNIGETCNIRLPEATPKQAD